MIKIEDVKIGMDVYFIENDGIVKKTIKTVNISKTLCGYKGYVVFKDDIIAVHPSLIYRTFEDAKESMILVYNKKIKESEDDIKYYLEEIQIIKKMRKK